MKKTILTLTLAMGLITVVSAQTKETLPIAIGTKTETHEHVDKATYVCPMKCEGDKVYDKEGKCPKCGMNLSKIEVGGKANTKKMACCADGGKKGHSCGMNMSKEKGETNETYSCPMKCEGDKTYSKAGDCPKCGMHLKESKKEEK